MRTTKNTKEKHNEIKALNSSRNEWASGSTDHGGQTRVRRLSVVYLHRCDRHCCCCCYRRRYNFVVVVVVVGLGEKMWSLLLRLPIMLTTVSGCRLGDEVCPACCCCC